MGEAVLRKMNSVYVSFSLRTFNTSLASNDEFEKDYQTVYKPLVKFLYSHPALSFSFSFSGIQLQYYKKKHNEFITILKQLVERKQIEILGGGFYEPILPLLYPVDRTGQIDLLSDEIRQTIGKRPRGITLFADCWDSSLVNCLQNCGIEYILLDSFIIPTDKRKFLPIFMSDLGKSIEIFPYYDNFIPNASDTALNFVDYLTKQVEKVEKKDVYCQLQPERIVNINLNHQQLVELLENKWFDSFYEQITVREDSRIKTIIPTVYRKNSSVKVPCYISSGINGSVAKWISQAFIETENKRPYPFTVHDFMNTYPQSHELYNRIMYVSMMVNQYKNDKMRKKAAREKLWQAQNGVGLLCTHKGTFSNSNYRQQCYKYLMEAEKILREGSDFKESVSCFDYNGDGLNEYVCRMQNYFSYIDITGGVIQELDILKNTGNYADNFSRYEEYDGVNDDYERGIFVDHLLTQEQFDNYVLGKPSGDGVFSKVKYTELKYSQNHHELQLCAEAVFQPTKQKIYLRKKYIINSTGMNVQYILQNLSEKPLKAIFAIESNFAHTNFDSENISYYNLEVVDNENRKEIDSSVPTSQNYDKSQLRNVDIIRLTDKQSGISFGLEPNENCGFCYYPIIFKRPDFYANQIVPVNMTFVSTMYWDIELAPGKETERTINFTITAVKKERKSH